MTILRFVRLAVVISVVVPIVGQAGPVSYSFSTGPFVFVTSSAPALELFLNSKTVSGTFTYDNETPFSRPGGINPEVSIYDDASSSLSASVGGTSFSDSVGPVIVGNELSPGGTDLLRVRSGVGTDFVGFVEGDYTLIGWTIQWTEPFGGLVNHLGSEILPPELPSIPARVLLEFSHPVDGTINALFVNAIVNPAGPPSPSDTDGDGIQNGIDGTFSASFNDQSGGASNNFTDQHLAGSTFGTVMNRSHLSLHVTDHATDGVVLEANGAALSFSGSDGQAVVGNDIFPSALGPVDGYRINTRGGLAGFQITATDPVSMATHVYTLVRVRISWFEGFEISSGFLSDQSLLPTLPTEAARLQFDFASTSITNPNPSLFYSGVNVTPSSSSDYSYSGGAVSSANPPGSPSDAALIAFFNNSTVSGTFTYDGTVPLTDEGEFLPVSIYYDAMTNMTGTVQGTAHIQMCNGPVTDLFLKDGDQLIGTCGSFHGQTIAGEAVVTIGTVTVTIPEGATAEIVELEGSGLSIASIGDSGEGGEIVVVEITDDGPITKTVEPGQVPAITSDADNDGIRDLDDLCPATGLDTQTSGLGLGSNRWGLLDKSRVFDQAPPQDERKFNFTTTDTKGCSCTQIVTAADLGEGHLKEGCSTGAMLEWIETTNSP